MDTGYGIGQCSSRVTMWELSNPRAVHERGGLRIGCTMNWASSEVKVGIGWGAIRGTHPLIPQTSSTTLLTMFRYDLLGHTVGSPPRQTAETLPYSSYSSWYPQHQTQYLICSSVSKLVCMEGMEQWCKALGETPTSIRCGPASNNIWPNDKYLKY